MGCILHVSFGPCMYPSHSIDRTGIVLALYVDCNVESNLVILTQRLRRFHYGCSDELAQQLGPYIVTTT